MVRRVTTYTCETCRRGYPDYEGARECEADHIISEAAALTAEKIKAAFDRSRNQDPRP
jgi:hypothetical protein